MTLQLFEQDQTDSIADASRNSVGELPSTFTDRIDEAWNQGRLVASSVSGSIRKSQALSDWMDEVKTKTGENLLAAFPDNPEAVTINDLNARLRQLRVKNPALDLPDLTDDELQRRADDIGRNQVSAAARMSRRETTFGGSVGGFLGSTGAALSDPVNMLAFPLAAPASFGVLGTALAWGAIAGGSQAVIEGLNAPSREQIEPGYIESGAPALNVLGAAGMGSVLGGGFKGLAAAWSRVKTGEWPRTIRDAGNVIENEAQIASTNRFPGADGEAFHRTELQRRIDELASGRPEFDQRPLPEGGILASYDAKLTPIMEARAKAAQASESAITFERDAARLPPTMERLSEVQLSEFRTAADQARQAADAARARLDAEGLSVTAEREALAQRQSGLSSLQDNVAGLRDDLARAEQRLADARSPIDDVTQTRLAAIDDQLKGASRETRALLENERAQITETLAKTSPEDRRLIASLTAERNGLQKAVTRAEKELAKSTASVDRTGRRLTTREQAIPRRRDAAASREASAQEAAATGLRRSVARLAEDGYGVRLPRDDAQALAQHVMQAAPEQVEQALRDVTEELVTRAVALRRATPDLPGIGRPSPVAQQRARVGYHTEEMRKGITAIAREVGYDMPREEAATIAAKLAGMTDDEAMAVLDELLLRPRTLADTLPGTGRGPAPAPRDVLAERQPETVAALRAELTPEKIDAMRTDPDLEETVSRDLDKLLAENPDFEVPVGAVIDEGGQMAPATRRLDDIIAEADSREAAAAEIKACVGPYPAEAV
jgi:predicted  nucleic acid-binding Zn-ribbon protein